MRLGILASTKNHLEDFVNIADSAMRQGHSVSVFFTAEGIELIHEREIAELSVNAMIDMVYCEFLSTKAGIPPDSIPSALRAGSQLDNALMLRDSDRVISL